MKFFDLHYQNKIIKKKIYSNFEKIFYKSDYINGGFVKDFENDLKKYSGLNCTTCGNGTDALLISLIALDAKPNDYIISSSFNYISAAEVSKILGCNIILTDIDETLNMCPISLEETIKHFKKKKIDPKFCITTSLFGNPINFQKINKILKQYKIKHISDLAQSFGAEYNNKKLESLSEISTTSFFPSKPLGCYGDGGAIFTKNAKIYHKVKSIKAHGFHKDKYNFVRVGMNSRLDTIQAAILIEKLKLQKKEINLRKLKFKKIYQSLRLFFNFQKILNLSSPSFSYLNIIPKKNSRKYYLRILKEKNIPTQIYYPKLVNEHKPYKESLFLNLNNAKFFSKNIFAIPFHSYMNDEEIDKIINVLKID